MEPRRWCLLVCTALALSACAGAAVTPRLASVADVVLVACGGLCGAALWIVGSRHGRALRGWRLFALAPLFAALGGVLPLLVAPTDPLDAAVLRWLPTVPGYLLAIAGGLTLVDRSRFRGRGRRVGVELLLFTTASVVTVQLLFVGPAGQWSTFATTERLVLSAGVLATSATMAAALTVLGAIESRRQRAALLLLVGSVLLTVGRGLGTSALLGGWANGTSVSRMCVVAGLAAVTWAALADPGPGSDRRPRSGASTRLGHLLPHLALVVATVVLSAATVAGHRPSLLSVTGLVLAVALVAVHRWVTARDEQLLGARLRRSEAWFRSLVQSGSDAVLILDDDLRVTWASPALARTLGPVAGELPGRSLPMVVHPDDVAGLLAALPSGEPDAPAPEPARGAGPHILRIADDSGDWRVFEANVSDLRADTSVGAVVLHCRDVTERHAREEALQSVAYSDPITGLPNRASFLLDLHRAVTPGAAPATLLLVEVEGLLKAREDVGREIVRNVVGEIGRRLRSTVRSDDVVARMGSGTFAVLTHATDDDPQKMDAEADQVAARCLAVVEQPIMTADGIVDLSASVGLAVAEPGLSVEDLLNRVGLAVRAARDRAAGTAGRYTTALGEAAARRERLRADLPGARDRNEFFLLFEPIVSLGEQRVVGVEALLRWRHPVVGDVTPAEFMRLATRAGVAGQLGRWALQEATTAVASLPAGDGTPIRLGFDVPTGWAAGGTLVADVAAALEASGLPAERLVLEITEGTVLADAQRIGLDLATLRLMGVHIALEGFGAGNSGLGQLTRLPIDVLKLDRSLISRVDRDPQSRALCESVTGIGLALGLDVVAEGVETAAQLGALCGMPCGFAQGFVISRPMPVADLRALLVEGAGALWPGLVGQR